MIEWHFLYQTPSNFYDALITMISDLMSDLLLLGMIHDVKFQL